MAALIETRDLGKRYGGQAALDGIALALEPGQTVALLGHNGAGKTTLIKLLLGLTRPSAGTARVFGKDPAGRDGPDLRRRIGYLPENLAFQGTLSGRELLGFYAGLKAAPGGQVAALLALVGLEDAADRRLATYSKGMRQRLGLAQALLGAPRLLFLDEPTNGLDPPLRQQFYDIVSELTRHEATAVISSHILTEIEARADRIAILRQGRLAAFGSLESLRRRSNLPYRLRFAVDPEAAGAVTEEMGSAYRVAHVEHGAIEFTCATDDKMQIVRKVASLNGAVQDVDILPPRLNEIYRHFMAGEAAP